MATANDVSDLTGYAADETDVRKAQAIVEVFAGRTESLITLPNDREWMKYAICWQVAYMSRDGNAVYEQANIASLTQNDTRIDFGDKSFAIAPLVIKTIERLSWHRSRAIDTRPWFMRGATYDEWVTD